MLPSFEIDCTEILVDANPAPSTIGTVKDNAKITKIVFLFIIVVSYYDIFDALVGL
ncbi:MAG: hypothetical protein ACJ71J_10700 [Nitrososphaeraceae archaeon]